MKLHAFVELFSLSGGRTIQVLYVANQKNHNVVNGGKERPNMNVSVLFHFILLGYVKQVKRRETRK